MDSTEESGAGDLRKNTYSGAGFMLRSAREEQGLALSDVATRTRIPLRQLEVIEAGAFSTLPSRTYAVGFARTYARAIGLDEATIIQTVRSELGDSAEPRTAVSSGMEPGDPAKLPSRGLAWAAGIGAVVLALGLFAWFGSRYGAGEGPAPITTEAVEEAPGEEPVLSAAEATPAPGSEVTFTALEENVWVRVYEEGGQRLLEKTLVKGESFTIPATANDPRLSTGRPDALAITVNAQSVARLSERPLNLGGEPVSASALLARSGAATPTAASTPAPTSTAAPETTRVRATSAVSARPVTEPITTTLPDPSPAAPGPATDERD
jgi:cytoskeleton protein RodZ